MKAPFVIFRKGQSTITLKMHDDWLVDVKEVKRERIVWDAMIILSDVKKFIRRRTEEGYSYIRRRRK